MTTRKRGLKRLTNEYGDIDARNLPPGYVHVSAPDAAKQCRKAGVSYRRALTGFGKSRRRRYPEFSGVVVTLQDAERVPLAAPCLARIQENKALAEHLNDVAVGSRKWRPCQQGVWTVISGERATFADLDGVRSRYVEGIGGLLYLAARNRKEVGQFSRALGM